MKFVDEVLQDWCDVSMASVLQSKLIRNVSVEPLIDAEWIVEAAAFSRLANSRGIRTTAVFENLDVMSKVHADFLESLVVACPLNGSSCPEVLGSIHESLVARRGLLQSRRRSTSRKAGGVFYTPQHVIDYIVHQTIDRRLERMEPAQIETLTVLDPAVGCGAFLLAAYRRLLDWHLNWYATDGPNRWPSDLSRYANGWRLSFRRRQSILVNHLFGVDLDDAAIQVARRVLWLELMNDLAEEVSEKATDAVWNRLALNLKHGHALIGSPFGQPDPQEGFCPTKSCFHWEEQFPLVATQGGFNLVIGNPPYRRERHYKQELAEIAATPLGRFRSPRMDLWYYFVHRGIELLRADGTLSFITNAYWLRGTGAEKLIAALRDDVHLEELFLLQNQHLFPGVYGQHSIFLLTKSTNDKPTTIKVVPQTLIKSDQTFVTGTAAVHVYVKTRQHLFVERGIDVWPEADRLLAKLNVYPRLNELGIVRQGIAENPASINRRTLERFVEEPTAKDWILGEGVFSLQNGEVERLRLAIHEMELLQPYHELSDLSRYWLAQIPSRQLIYSTKQTCPSIDEYPALQRHLERFRPILDARRETASGSNRWWHLHWPRDQQIWRSQKLIALQMAVRPSFVPAYEPTYVSFSANVFVPSQETREDLRYLCGLLNSRVLWAWFEHHAKHRGIGLEINGNVLDRVPIRRIDFGNPSDVRQHDQLISLVESRIHLEKALVQGLSVDSRNDADDIANQIQEMESEIDELVASLYQLDVIEAEIAINIKDQNTH